MKIYTIEQTNGDKRTATNLTRAIAIARQMLGVARVYRGAEYQTDRPLGDGREYCMALDIWASRKIASVETNKCANVVISWANL